jgi:hypothetical protein|tara:strand:- start:4213 stop:5769 length:1557 start_codon:yes stop_codon:yes gene_type:complete
MSLKLKIEYLVSDTIVSGAAWAGEEEEWNDWLKAGSIAVMNRLPGNVAMLTASMAENAELDHIKIAGETGSAPVSMRLLGVYRQNDSNWYRCREMDQRTAMYSQVSGSLYATGNTDPGFWVAPIVEGGPVVLNILPASMSDATARAFYVAYPSPNVNDDFIIGFPEELEQAVLWYAVASWYRSRITAAGKLLFEVTVPNYSAPTAIDLSSITVPAYVGPADIDLSGITVPSYAASGVVATWTSPGSLDISTVTVPTMSSISAVLPVWSSAGASAWLGTGVGAGEDGMLPGKDDLYDGSSAFGAYIARMSDEIADDEVELANAAATWAGTRLSQVKTRMDAVRIRWEKDVEVYEAELGEKSGDYRLDLDKYRTQIREKIDEYLANVKRQVDEFNAEVNSFQATWQRDVGEYNADISKYQQQVVAEIQSFTARAQESVGKLQADVGRYGSEVNAEVVTHRANLDDSIANVAQQMTRVAGQVQLHTSEMAGFAVDRAAAMKEADAIIERYVAVHASDKELR